MARLWTLLLMLAAPVFAQQVVVQKDFIDLRTGPGRGYPVVQVALKQDSLQLLKQRTAWIKVQYRQQQLWLAASELEYLYPAGTEQSVATLWQAEQGQRRWQLGLAGGDFAGTSYYQLSGSYLFSDVVALELSAGQGSGQQASSQQYLLQLSISPWPHWQVSPYIALGGGVLLTRPRTVLVQTAERSSPLATMELGVNYPLTRRVQANLRYRRALVSTDRDVNEETNTWLIGLRLAF
ncbi:SH3 domain-containing protein [Arsukibacterium perlucidum]|uniref:SH3 domain-containing protein n=1 Tax=Arsukibacterium perlucidum TaxID=368811 RepID=UPI0012F7625C|nr:SH3 domain-containing protein [Arsukibacterium perlucidum]